MSPNVRRRLRLGVFGGSFDPPHLGHVALAERARDELELTRVLFVPAPDPPHKRGRPRSAFRHRLAMTRLAVRGFRPFEVSDLEARRSGPSYTVDTLRELNRRFPAAELWLLLGEDSACGFEAWREPRAIVSLARLAVAPRGGVREHRAPTWLRRRLTWLSGPVLDIASSELRARARRGRSIRGLVPDGVDAYARRHRLYLRTP